MTVGSPGTVVLQLDHRYSFEFDGTRWDGGQVRISVNGGAFAPVPSSAFSANGYTGQIQGNNVLFADNHVATFKKWDDNALTYGPDSQMRYSPDE